MWAALALFVDERVGRPARKQIVMAPEHDQRAIRRLAAAAMETLKVFGGHSQGTQSNAGVALDAT